ncbi:protein RRP5 homolog [Pecten maximus]|uniref:protein RRP5 homolog n=1 Tax=Pecten maximus TaxID=6579 RepID=UPI00145901DC|nr:protein RRP5 homolog [Pecten maximus]
MEENFPRGGSSKRVKKDSAPVKVDDADLFHSEESETPKKKRKKEFGKENVAKKVKVTPKNDISEKIVERTCALKKNMVSNGMLLMGSVTKVEDYSLCVGLPNGLSGSVQITHISDAYTQLLQKLTEASSSESANALDVPSLHEIFRVGQLLPCRVFETSAFKKKHNFKLTINPREINEGMVASHIKNGMVLHGCIQSLEDHGYVVDIGISGTRAFLNHSDAEKFNNGESLHVGEAVRCLVTTEGDGSEDVGESLRVVKVSIDPKKVSKSQLGSSVRLPLTCIVPGMKVTAKVTKADEDRLLVKFLQFRGHIHCSHLPKPAMTYKTRPEIEAVVLYVNGSTKIISLSALPHLVDYSGVATENQFGSLQRGDILTNATVTNVDSHVGVYFSLDDGVKAFCDIPNLSDSLVENVKDNFKIDDIHKCRVMDFNPVDNLVIISLKKSIFTKFLQFQDILPGTTLECTVHQIHEKGVSVNITNRLSGFIPNLHLSDFPLKYPGKKFTPGTTIKCRVLLVNIKKKQVLLTRKKSLVNSKLPILTSWSQLERDQVLDGFICSITDKGVLVAFYNNIKGWVPRRELSEENIPFPEKVFIMGQVVKCRVLNWDEESSRLTLSFKGTQIKLTPFGKNRVVEVPDGFEIGMLVDGKVQSVTKTGVNVTLEPTGVEAFLPRNHLSDNLDCCDLLMTHYREGVALKELMYLSKESVLTVSHRKSMCDNTDLVVSEFDKLQPGLLIPGSITRLMDYGIFVEFPGGMRALVPNKYAADTSVRNTSVLYAVGQAVCAKILQVDREKSRILASLRMNDCYHGDTDIGINLLKDMLREMDMVQKLSKETDGKKKLWKHHVGEVCTGKVTEVTEIGLLCVLDSGCKAVITNHNVDSNVDLVKGDEVKGLITYLDMEDECVELCTLKDVVKGFVNWKGPPAAKITADQKLNCRIVLVKKSFALGTLKGPGAGTLAYIPVKRHLNDVLEVYQFYPGQVHPVIVKQLEKTHVLCSLELHEKRKLEIQGVDSEMLRNVKTPHDYKAGDIVMASVKTVYPLQINIVVGEAHGRVHISEVTDTIDNGEMPLNDLQPGEEIRVKVVGFREGKTYSYLPISHPNRKYALLECSVKPSKLKKEDVDSTVEKEHTYTIGDRVQAFVQNYHKGILNVSVSSTVQGQVSLVNLSDDLTVLEDPDKHFVRGQGYNATVIGVDNCKRLDLSFTDKGEIEVGQIVRGCVLTTTFALELQLALSMGYKGMASCTDLSDTYTDNPLRSFKHGQIMDCRILSVDKQIKLCGVSLRQSRLKKTKKSSKIQDPEINGVDSVSKDQVVRGYIIGFNKGLLTVCIGNGVHGTVSREELSDYQVKSRGAVFYKGRVVTARVLSVEETVSLTLRESRTGVTDLVPPDMRTGSSGSNKESAKTDVKARKRKLSETDTSSAKGGNSSQDSEEETEAKKVKGKKEKNVAKKKTKAINNPTENEEKILATPPACEISKMPRLSVAAGLSWDADLARDSLPTPSDSDEDDSDEEDRRSTKKTKAEIRAEKKEEEKKLDEFERRQLEGDNQPATVDEFDRLVLTSPDSSLVWLQYMAFHLQTAEIDKARAVAERALKTISFREEQEKQNVWVAYLNLENMYGSSDLLHKVLERAIAQNEPSKIYTQMINIYVKSGKIDEAENLHNKLVRRYSQDKEIWISFMMFYYKHERVDDARKLLQRCLKSLNIKHHVEMIAKCAQLEFKFGDTERGRTMFESVLGNYPKRTDLWSVYLDMVVKTGECQEARQLFERVIHLKQSAKKMKFFYKKYLDFEKEHGDSEAVENVKKKALEYVESQGYTDE